MGAPFWWLLSPTAVDEADGGPHALPIAEAPHLRSAAPGVVDASGPIDDRLMQRLAREIDAITRRLVIEDASDGEFVQGAATPSTPYEGKYRPEWTAAGEAIAGATGFSEEWKAARDAIAGATGFGDEWRAARDSLREGGR